MAERYPLEIENIGEDVYTLMSRGHHDIHAFMRKVREDYDWPLGVPSHIWMKTRPAPKGSGYRCFYDPVDQGTRGAWPATCVWEAWHEDAYEAKFPAEAQVPAGVPERCRGCAETDTQCVTPSPDCFKRSSSADWGTEERAKAEWELRRSDGVQEVPRG